MAAFEKREDFLPLRRPVFDDEHCARLRDILQSGLLSGGPHAALVERELKTLCEAQYAVALNSSTAALHLSYITAGARPFDEIVVPALARPDTADAILHADARPVLADIDLETLTVSADNLAPVLSPSTKAVVAFDFAGLPCDLDPILRLAGDYNALVVEDASHALGATYKGRPVGAASDMTVFSFSPIGAGGAVAGASAGQEKTVRELSRRHLCAPERHGPDFPLHQPPFDYAMLELQAAPALAQLQSVKADIRARNELACGYRAAFADTEELALPKIPAYEHSCSWELFPVLLRTEKLNTDRDSFLKELRELNIGAQSWHRPTHLHPLYEKLGFKRGRYPKAEYACERLLLLPIFPSMTQKDLEDVELAVKHLLAKHSLRAI